MRLSLTKTDPSLERDGVWVAIRYGVEVNVSRMGNPRAEAWRAKLSAEDRRLLDGVKEYTRRPELYRTQLERVGALMRENIAETVLNDWRGLEDDEDQPIPFDADAAKRVMADHDWLYADVLEAATTRETFFQTEVRETGKSSRKQSGGKASTPTG